MTTVYIYLVPGGSELVSPNPLTQRCLGREDLEFSKNVETGFVGIVLLVVTTLLATTMYTNIQRFVKSKSKDDKVPIKFGRYQRNVVTMKQCFLLGIMLGVFLLVKKLIQSILQLESSDLRKFLLCSNLTRNILFELIFPIGIIINLWFNMPEFYVKVPRTRGTFYTRQNPILPRRPSRSAADNENLYPNIVSSNRVIFVLECQGKSLP